MKGELLQKIKEFDEKESVGVLSKHYRKERAEAKHDLRTCRPRGIDWGKKIHD